MDDARQVIETAPAGDFGELVKVRKFVVHTEEVGSSNLSSPTIKSMSYRIFISPNLISDPAG